ncbi:MAG: cache domain-containing protein, partial [Halieaceae bacterium]
MTNKRFWLISATGLAVLMVGVAWGFGQWHLKQYERQISTRLQLLNELRQGALELYFGTAEAEIKAWSSSPIILGSQAALAQTWSAGEKIPLAAAIRSAYVTDNPYPPGKYSELSRADDSAYSEAHALLHDTARKFVTERGYYDFFLIGRDGDVYYTVEKEADFATSLQNGPWKESGLAAVYRRALTSVGAVVMSDLAGYEPSKGAPAIFMANAIVSPEGETLGVIALQLPTDTILSIMNYTSGMGESGETYLVGEDLLMRSNSRFSEVSTVLRQRVDTATVAMALAGEEGVQYTPDYRDIDVLSSYDSIEVARSRWAVMAEIDRDEVVALAAQERPAIGGALLLLYGLSLWSIW